MPRVGFEPTILLLERTKTVHALAHAATMISSEEFLVLILPVPI
jgi:hypothetical protein